MTLGYHCADGIQGQKEALELGREGILPNCDLVLHTSLRPVRMHISYLVENAADVVKQPRLPALVPLAVLVTPGLKYFVETCHIADTDIDAPIFIQTGQRTAQNPSQPVQYCAAI